MINIVRYFYPGIDVGNLTIYQANELIMDLAEIKKMESGDEAKSPEHMTAQEKIEMYKRQGLV